MYTGILYSVFVAFLVGTVGLIVFWQLRKIRKKRKVEYSRGLDYFLLFQGVVWIAGSLRDYFSWLGRFDIDMLIWNWIISPLTYLHLIPAVFYFGWSFFKKKTSRFLFIGGLNIAILIVTFTSFKYGSTPGVMTYWGIKPFTNELTQTLFLISLYIPAVTVVVIEFYRRLRNWIRTKSLIEKQLFGFSLGFLIYTFTAISNILILFQGWLLLLSRTGVMISAFIFYLSATGETEE